MFTVFFENEVQDFETYKEAKEYGEERIRYGLADDYIIEATDGEVV